MLKIKRLEHSLNTRMRYINEDFLDWIFDFVIYDFTSYQNLHPLSSLFKNKQIFQHNFFVDKIKQKFKCLVNSVLIAQPLSVWYLVGLYKKEVAHCLHLTLGNTEKTFRLTLTRLES